jgi:hypothetical protein
LEKTIQQPKRTGFTILWKCLLAALPLLAFALLFVLFPMHFYDVEYPRWRWEQQALSDTKIEADVVFLGDSLIQSGIIPVAWGEGAINLALGGATSAEMDFALDQYLNYHDAPELIVMGYGQNHYIEMNGYWNRSLYFHYLPLGRQIDLIERAWKMNDRTVFGGHIACEDTLAFSSMRRTVLAGVTEYDRRKTENANESYGILVFRRRAGILPDRVSGKLRRRLRLRCV